jgi:hypothetical protein
LALIGATVSLILRIPGIAEQFALVTYFGMLTGTLVELGSKFKVVVGTILKFVAVNKNKDQNSNISDDKHLKAKG